MSDRDADDAAAAARAFLSTISMDAPAPVLTRPQRSPSAPDTTAVPRSLPPHATTAAVHPPARLQRPRSPSAPDAHAGARSFLTSIELSPERGPAPCPLPTAAPAPAASALGGTHVRRPPSAGLASCLPHRHAHGHNHGHGHSASRFLLFGAVRRTQSSHEPPTALPAGTPPTTQDQGLYQQQQQQQQQGQHALCGYAGVAEVCSQSRRRQRHVRLVFASGAACPLIAASYRLDRRVHIRDFGPYDVQLPAHGHRGRHAPRTPALPHLRAGLPPWLRADSPDASLTVSDTASSSALSDSPQTPRRSYAACLAPRWVGHAAVEPAVLDPWDEHEHHATVVALTGLRASVVPYLGARAARDEADARFLREHPGLRDTGLRVTKLRKRKMSLLQITVSTNLDVSTAALALCLVDDAVQQGLLRDDTTALGCACCFLLAAKFNEMLTPQAVKSIRDRLAKELKVSASDITSHEFLFFSKLQFSLFRAPSELAAYHALVQRKLPAPARPHTGRSRTRVLPPPSPPTPATFD